MKTRDQRHKVLIRATLRADRLDCEACIRDVSASGLLLQVAAAPPRGSYVEVLANGHAIVGRVVWSKQRRLGVAVLGRLNVRALVDGATGRAPAIAWNAAPPLRPRAAQVAAPEAAKARTDMLMFAIILLFVLSLIAAAAGTAYETLSAPLNQALRQLQR